MKSHFCAAIVAFEAITSKFLSGSICLTLFVFISRAIE